MGLLQGKVAVITGGTRGFGLAMAQAYVEAGASVVIASRSQASVDCAVTRLDSDKVGGLSCDVTDLNQVQALKNHAVNTFGHLDIWVNNAGIAGTYGPTAHIAPEEFKAVVNTNIIGAYHGSWVAMQHFVPQGHGKLINILGHGEQGPVPMQNAYSSSKG